MNLWCLDYFDNMIMDNKFVSNTYKLEVGLITYGRSKIEILCKVEIYNFTDKSCLTNQIEIERGHHDFC